MRIFITGGTGFAGSHLLDNLLAEGHHVTALVHGETSHQDLPQHPALQPLQGSLLDEDVLNEAVAAAQPDVIYHLAGQASPGRSWQAPALTMAINAGGTANLLQAAVAYGRPRVIVVTSAEIYGPVSAAMLPLTEETEARPRHPYGISKQAAGQFVDLYWQRYQLPVIEARPFNHVGPRQALGFVVPDFASQLAAIKLGMQEPLISVGNLDAQRDFTDVRDVARAYSDLAATGQPGLAYLICSGRPVSIRSLLETLSDLAQVDVEIAYDSARMRPSDTPVIYGSHERLSAHTGWQPQIELRQSLSDALGDWLGRLSVDQAAAQ
jgi:GDP-4-dehydro-6-deoxy-D-mannose reductase